VDRPETHIGLVTRRGQGLGQAMDSPETHRKSRLATNRQDVTAQKRHLGDILHHFNTVWDKVHLHYPLGSMCLSMSHTLIALELNCSRAVSYPDPWVGELFIELLSCRMVLEEE
jgi:hypothetical protein